MSGFVMEWEICDHCEATVVLEPPFYHAEFNEGRRWIHEDTDSELCDDSNHNCNDGHHTVRQSR